MTTGVSIIIPTCNGGGVFEECLLSIQEQEYEGPVQLIVADSESQDGTLGLAKRAEATILNIPKKEFHHAGTRNRAVSLAAHQRVVMLVQDAVPVSAWWLQQLTDALDLWDTAAVYTSQVPHGDATPYARYEVEGVCMARGEKPRLQAIDSLESFKEMPYDEAYRRIGLDNVCAIYRKNLLEETPFPMVGFAEDLAWAQSILLGGHRILYQPEIVVRHSHNRSPQYAFNRQIINSFWCAQIMGRVKEDLSFIGLQDLMRITRSVFRWVLDFEKNLTEKIHPWFHREAVPNMVLSRYPLLIRARAFLGDWLFKQSQGVSLGIKEIQNGTQGQIQWICDFIRNKYGLNTREALTGVLDQAIANILGRLYGEVYASCVLRGDVGRLMNSFMKGFMSGV